LFSAVSPLSRSLSKRPSKAGAVDLRGETKPAVVSLSPPDSEVVLVCYLVS